MEKLGSSPQDLPDMNAEPGWVPFEMPLNKGGGKSFIDADPKGNGIALKMFIRESDNRLFAKVWFGSEATGPPRHAHGGCIAAVLDHVMGLAAWVAGHPVVAATITINFHDSVPLAEICTVECWVEKVQDKKVSAAGRIYGRGGPEKAYSSSEGLFITQPIERFRGMMDP